MIVITGAHKAFALYKAIEEGVNHMWTVSAFQQHPRTIFVCDEDATLELRVKTVKYFKGTSVRRVLQNLRTAGLNPASTGAPDQSVLIQHQIISSAVINTLEQWFPTYGPWATKWASKSCAEQ